MEVINTVVAVLSSATITVLLTHVISYFSKRNNNKTEYAKQKVRAYSMVIRYMNKSYFKMKIIGEAIKEIESILYENYDIVAPQIVYKFDKFKAQFFNGVPTDVITKNLFKLYFSLQVEYNKSKKEAAMDFDIRYTNTDPRVISRYCFWMLVFWTILPLILIIQSIVTGMPEPDNLNSIFVGLYILLILFLAVIIVIFLINEKITRNSIQKEWNYIISGNAKQQAAEDGETDDQAKQGDN